MSYCSKVNKGKLNCHHKYYHDNIYGFPAKSDNELFGRLVLEINQAGLSWDIILKRKKQLKMLTKIIHLLKLQNSVNPMYKGF